MVRPLLLQDPTERLRVPLRRREGSLREGRPRQGQVGREALRGQGEVFDDLFAKVSQYLVLECRNLDNTVFLGLGGFLVN